VARDITDANKTRQVLRQQTEELRRIFETSQDLILVMDSRGFLVQISPSCEAILGYRPEEMIGRSGADFVHPTISRTPARKCARRAAGTSEHCRCALHPQGRAGGMAVLARRMVRSGQAVLLRRP
jgi:PAS domain S-box-containing protein